MSAKVLNDLFHRIKPELEQAMKEENGCISHFEVLNVELSMVGRYKEIIVGSLRSYVDGIPWVQLSVSELVLVLFELLCFFLIRLHFCIITLLKLMFHYLDISAYLVHKLALYLNTSQILFVCFFIYPAVYMGI